MPDIAYTAPHFIPWFALAGVLWSSLFVEFPGLKAYLGRGWFLGFFAGVLLVALGPALYLAVAYFRGTAPVIGAGGITVGALAFAPPFTWKFFALSGAIGLGAGLLKWAILSRLTREPRGIAYVVGLLLFTTFGTTAALSELSVDPVRVVAQISRRLGVPMRLPAGQTAGRNLDDLLKKTH